MLDFLDYVCGLLENGDDENVLTPGDGTGVAYHSHCQQRTLGLEANTEAVLYRLGYVVRTSDVECCRMAGSFGYKTEYYELSMDLCETLAKQFENVTDDRTVVASGTSSMEQLDALLTSDPRHPIELLNPEA